MAERDGLRFVIYDKAGGFKRQVRGVESTADILANAVSTAEFTVRDTHASLPAATADGARCGVWFRGVERFRGTITETPGEGPVGTVTVRVESDLRKYWHWMGWPVPTAGIGVQVDKARVYSGTTEAVFKEASSHAFTRLGVPWTTAPNLGRGLASTRADLRFDYLGDKLIPMLDSAGLVAVLTYGPGPLQVVVDVREPDVVVGRLTLKSGVLDRYRFNRQSPSGTRFVIGGAGDGADREFDLWVNTAREAAFNDIIEVFVNASSAEEGADLTLDAVEPNAESAPAAMLAADLIETDRLVYGKHYIEGDFLQVAVGPINALQQIRGVTVADSRRGGVKVTPRFGDIDEDDTDAVLARGIARLARGQRQIGRR